MVVTSGAPISTQKYAQIKDIVGNGDLWGDIFLLVAAQPHRPEALKRVSMQK
ncbi:hypothetical protein ACLK1X_21380 [Escherichia coli]